MVVPIAIDKNVCEKVASLLISVSIPSDKEDSALEGFTSDETAAFYLLLVAICHQTQSLQGMVAGSYCRGWDYLSRRLESAARDDRFILAPSSWTTISTNCLKGIFHDEQYGDTLTDLDGRTSLIQNLGQVMVQYGSSSPNDLYSLAGKRIAGLSPNLQELLARFRAYNDPVRKKSLFFLGLMMNSGVWSYIDVENLGPPVDYHEVRGHLRLGTVIVLDQALREKLLSRAPVTESEDVAIRQAVYDAIICIASQPNMPRPMTLHYLFWNIFRAICLRESPYRHLCPTDCGLPARYMHLLHLDSEACQCPFVTTCASANAKDLYWEHTFLTEWY